MTYNFPSLPNRFKPRKFEKNSGATHILAPKTMMFDRFQLTGKCQTDLPYRSRANVFSCFRFDVLLVNGRFWHTGHSSELRTKSTKIYKKRSRVLYS